MKSDQCLGDLQNYEIFKKKKQLSALKENSNFLL